ncbi:sulfate ABC transporter substrate-binding protein [Nitrosospira lacus]
MSLYRSRFIFALLVILLSLGVAAAALHSISYSNKPDSTWEMYEDFNVAFARHWKARSGVNVTVKQAHSGSGVPVRAMMDGQDIVTLALSYDIEALKKNTRFTLPDWQGSSPQSPPYTSTVVFLVRKGNPKQLKDWGDLVRPGIEVITPSPKTSGDARWNYLAAWGYALQQSGGNEANAFEFVRKLFSNVTIPDSGPRNSRPSAAMANFVERGLGDVLLVWENEAHRVVRDHGGDKFEIVTPSMSIMAEPIVSIVDNAATDGERDVARAYIDYLHTAKAQDIAGKHYYRPRDERVAGKYATQFPSIDLFTVDELFGGWKLAESRHFARGGVFDQMQVK